MNKHMLIRLVLIVALIGINSDVWAGSVLVPYSFAGGTKAMASEVNSNFNALATEVNDNDSRIAALEAAIADMQTRIADLESQNADLVARLEAVENNTVLALDGILTLGVDNSG